MSVLSAWLRVLAIIAGSSALFLFRDHFWIGIILQCIALATAQTVGEIEGRLDRIEKLLIQKSKNDQTL